MFPRIYQTETNEDIEGEETTQENADDIDSNLSIISQICSVFNLSYLEVLEMSYLEVLYLFDFIVQKNEREVKQMQEMKNN